MLFDLLYVIIGFSSMLMLASIILIYYRYWITTFERKYFKLFRYYPSYFTIYSKNKFDYYYDNEKISYDKNENTNIVVNIDGYSKQNCCSFYYSIYCSICCLSNYICCRNAKSKFSDLFNYQDVMSKNFKDKNVFNLIEHYKNKLDKLLSETKSNEWKLNEITNSQETKDNIIDIISHEREELESRLETEPLNILKDLSDIYKKEKITRKMTNDLENKIKIFTDINTYNKREIYICREKINELYKYIAM